MAAAADVEASGPYLPRTHAVPAQAVPLVVWYCPEGHGVQEAVPVTDHVLAVVLLVHTMLDEPA